MKILTSLPSAWDVDIDPTAPLSTWTRVDWPIPVIGPTAVVPKPIFWIFINSLLIFRRSVGIIVEIPLKANIVDAVPICPPAFPDNVCAIGVNLSGYWLIPSSVIMVFSLPNNIANSWAFPSPEDPKDTFTPASAFALVVASLNSSSLSLIAYTIDGNGVPLPYVIAVDPTPTKVDFGVYDNSSPVLKKWFCMVNVPVERSNWVEFVGLKDFAKIGVPSFFATKSVLLILLPFFAL